MLVQDPTCARGVEASIHCKILSKPDLQEGCILILKQVDRLQLLTCAECLLELVAIDGHQTTAT